MHVSLQQNDGTYFSYYKQHIRIRNAVFEALVENTKLPVLMTSKRCSIECPYQTHTRLHIPDGIQIPKLKEGDYPRQLFKYNMKPGVFGCRLLTRNRFMSMSAFQVRQAIPHESYVCVV